MTQVLGRSQRWKGTQRQQAGPSGAPPPGDPGCRRCFLVTDPSPQPPVLHL